MATVMARAGASVLVLERQARFQDHVRGEILWPWGARLTQLLEIEPLLLAAGALGVRWLDGYDERSAGPTRGDIGAVISGVAGSINLTHPEACAALIDAATLAGADVRMGVRDLRVSAGNPPIVRWVDGSGAVQDARSKLIVGADGRRSSARSQAAISFEVDPPTHLIAGLLVEGIEETDEPVNLMARESDLLFYSFPQAAGRARLYFCFPIEQRSRFAGSNGAQRFLDATKLRSLDGVGGWRRAAGRPMRDLPR